MRTESIRENESMSYHNRMNGKNDEYDLYKGTCRSFYRKCKPELVICITKD
jgi:hypothetical protein